MERTSSVLVQSKFGEDFSEKPGRQFKEDLSWSVLPSRSSPYHLELQDAEAISEQDTEDEKLTSK
jgi:hypothetical protein